LSLDQNIDIHAENDFIFWWSCGFGHLEVVKWLWSLDQNIDIHSENDYAFRKSCTGEHLEVAKWLCTLCNDYYLEHDDNNIINWKILKSSLSQKLKIITNKNLNIKDECIICKSNDIERINFNCNNKYNHCYCIDCLENAEKNDCFKDKCLVCFEKVNLDNCRLVIV
jgi:hypothetical protein